MLEWVKGSLTRDTSLPPARYVGAPSALNDWGGLYKKNGVRETLKLIERESRIVAPHRIILLYVPSRDSINLISALNFVCFPASLSPQDYDPRHDGNPIGWRHEKSMVEGVINQTLRNALRVTNALKAEITDKRISPLTLPAHNFYYPNSHATINSVYHGFAQSPSGAGIGRLKERLSPSRFTRDKLPAKAFKGKQNTDRFFQDHRGRVFPPDMYHAQNRSENIETRGNRLSLALSQRYRFGVTVRDGNLHYDVQYELPRQLRGEPMYCGVEGEVLVTGSHANVGVNDVIWVPDGKKVTKETK